MQYRLRLQGGQRPALFGDTRSAAKRIRQHKTMVQGAAAPRACHASTLFPECAAVGPWTSCCLAANAVQRHVQDSTRRCSTQPLTRQHAVPRVPLHGLTKTLPGSPSARARRSCGCGASRSSRSRSSRTSRSPPPAGRLLLSAGCAARWRHTPPWPRPRLQQIGMHTDS